MATTNTFFARGLDAGFDADFVLVAFVAATFAAVFYKDIMNFAM